MQKLNESSNLIFLPVITLFIVLSVETGIE